LLYTYGSQTMWKKSKIQPENHRFLHEIHWFFKVFKMTKTTSSLILENSQGTRSSSYLNLEYLKKQNQWLFKIQRTIHTTLLFSFLPTWLWIAQLWSNGQFEKAWVSANSKLRSSGIISVCLCSQIPGATNKFAVCLFSALHISANGKGSTLNLALQKLKVWSPDFKHIVLHPISYFGVGEFLKSVEHAIQT